MAAVAAQESPAGDKAADGFLLLPGGDFLMGGPPSERLREADEVQHTVHVSAFYADPYEVTQEDYESVTGSGRRKCPAGAEFS